jgi:RNA polymerase sigma-70 factor (ECF subfamily)
MERMKEISDQLLLFEIAERNDEDAFRMLFERYSSRLFNLLYRMTNHYEDTNDLLQEVFIRVYRNKHKCFKMKNFKGWIYTVALNIARDYIRVNKRRNEVVLDERKGNTEENDPLRKSEAAEIKRKILSALKKLNIKYRAVFTLRDIEGLSYQEISEALKIEEGTVKSRLNRARLQLAHELKETFRRE